MTAILPFHVAVSEFGGGGVRHFRFLVGEQERFLACLVQRRRSAATAQTALQVRHSVPAQERPARRAALATVDN